MPDEPQIADWILGANHPVFLALLHALKDFIGCIICPEHAPQKGNTLTSEKVSITARIPNSTAKVMSNVVPFKTYGLGP